MTYAPRTISDAMAVLTHHAFGNSGIVGDAAHRARASYHNGADAIDQYNRTRLNDYSIKLDRDFNGLTNASAGMDIGKGSKTLADLQAISKWLVARCQAGAPGTKDIREVIYSPDGKVVKRWDNWGKHLYDGYPTGTGQGDSTHLWHTHISFFRDSEQRDKTAIFNPYFGIAPTTPPDTATEDPMYPIARYLPGYSATIKATANVRATPDAAGALVRNLKADEQWPSVIGFVKGAKDPDNADAATNILWLERWTGSAYEYTAFSNVKAGPTAPVVDDGYTAATQAAAVKAATDPLNAQVVALTAALAKAKSDVTAAATIERARIAQKEAERINAI